MSVAVILRSHFLALDLREAKMAETACPGSCFCLCSSVVRACIVCWFTQCLVMFAHICSSVNGPRAAPKVEYSILEISVPRHSQRSVAPSWLCRVPCYWKKLWPKWTKIHKSINFLPNIKSDVMFFFLHNVDYGTAKKMQNSILSVHF